VDVFTASRDGEWAGIHITALGRAGTVALRNPISSCRDRRANRKTHQFCARDTHSNAAARRDTNPDGHTKTHGDTDARGDTIANARSNTDADSHSGTNTTTNADTHPGPNPNPDSCAPDLQPCLRDRDGKRGVAQHYW
jgi:hypothetical protein